MNHDAQRCRPPPLNSSLPQPAPEPPKMSTAEFSIRCIRIYAIILPLVYVGLVLANTSLSPEPLCGADGQNQQSRSSESSHRRHVNHLDVDKAKAMLQSQGITIINDNLGKGAYGFVVSGLNAQGQLRAFKLCSLDEYNVYPTILNGAGDKVRVEGWSMFDREVRMMKAATDSSAAEHVVRYYRDFILDQPSWLTWIYRYFSTFFSGEPTPNDEGYVDFVYGGIGVIEMEFLEGGALYSVLLRLYKAGKLDEKLGIWLLAKAAISLRSLHAAHIHHHDMHFGNFLVEKISSNHTESTETIVRRVVVSDFGMANRRVGAVRMAVKAATGSAQKEKEENVAGNEAIANNKTNQQQSITAAVNPVRFSRNDGQRFCFYLQTVSFMLPPGSRSGIYMVASRCLQRFQDTARSMIAALQKKPQLPALIADITALAVSRDVNLNADLTLPNLEMIEHEEAAALPSWAFTFFNISVASFVVVVLCSLYLYNALDRDENSSNGDDDGDEEDVVRDNDDPMSVQATLSSRRYVDDNEDDELMDDVTTML